MTIKPGDKIPLNEAPEAYWDSADPFLLVSSVSEILVICLDHAGDTVSFALDGSPWSFCGNFKRESWQDVRAWNPGSAGVSPTEDDAEQQSAADQIQQMTQERDVALAALQVEREKNRVLLAKVISKEAPPDTYPCHISHCGNRCLVPGTAAGTRELYPICDDPKCGRRIVPRRL